MNLEILSNLIITKVYSATTMYTEKMPKLEEAKIIIARRSLAIGIAVTFLFKGQWILWIVFICMYCLYVNKAKKEAIEADKKTKTRKNNLHQTEF